MSKLQEEKKMMTQVWCGEEPLKYISIHILNSYIIYYFFIFGTKDQIVHTLNPTWLSSISTFCLNFFKQHLY